MTVCDGLLSLSTGNRSVRGRQYWEETTAVRMWSCPQLRTRQRFRSQRAVFRRVYENVLLPTDGTDDVRTVTEEALDIAARDDATVHVVVIADTTALPTEIDERVLLSGSKETGQDIVDEVFEGSWPVPNPVSRPLSAKQTTAPLTNVCHPSENEFRHRTRA